MSPRLLHALGHAALVGLVLLAGRAAHGEDGALPRVSIPFVGIEAIDADDPADVAPARLELAKGLTAALVRTVPMPWDRIEPHAPVLEDRHLHDWEALDRLVGAWQGIGYEVVLVLTPASSWASLPAEQSAWARSVDQEFPKAEAAVLLARGRGATPPRLDAWGHWERFVQDVVERYDADGKDDMPGLARSIRWIQIGDRPTSPTTWTGSAQDYLRLLHHASLGATRASPRVKVAHGTVDFGALGYPPEPDERTVRRRLGEQLAGAPAGLTFEEKRAFDFSVLTLSLRGLFRAVPHAGSDHLADTVVDLAYTRRVVDDGAGPEAEVWLVDDPPEKLGRASWPRPQGPSVEEERIRARWRATARRAEDSPERKTARSWLATGRAYDVVRTLAEARAAGADRIFLGGGGGGFDVFVERDEAGGWRRTPAFYALRQAASLLTGHGGAAVDRIGGSATVWRFTFPAQGSRPWVVAVALDPDLSWAGDPREGWPVREVAIALPDGPHIVEQVALEDGTPNRRKVRVRGGTLTLLLTPAPVWIYPDA